MAKKNVTYVSRDTLMAAIAASGIPTQEKAGWTLVGQHGTKGPRIYVPKTKGVGRIDVCGLGDRDGLRALGGESFGAVTHQVDMSRPEPEILATLDDVLTALAVAEPTPAKVRVKRDGAPKPASSPTDVKQDLKSRIDLIRAVANEKRVPVASSTLLAADELPSAEEVELLPDAE